MSGSSLVTITKEDESAMELLPFKQGKNLADNPEVKSWIDLHLTTVLIQARLERQPLEEEWREIRRLVLLQHGGSVTDFRAHAFTFILGPDCRYTPDYFVVRDDGTIEFHEVKGPFIRDGDDGMVKLRTATRLLPWFRFVLPQEQKDKTWTLTEMVP